LPVASSANIKNSSRQLRIVFPSAGHPNPQVGYRDEGFGCIL
jgi:hypothetical protein